MSTSAPARPTEPAGREGAAPAVQARRVIFIDLGRALAVLFMLYGHTVHALLAPEYMAGAWFDVWTFQRGLTSSLFLLLSGFSFSVATSRHWATHLAWSPALVKRLRRFGLFILLGYGLHFPVSRIGDLLTLSDERLRSFLAVDVLQLIGVTFIVVQLLVLAVRSRQVFAVVTLALAAATIAATPAAWAADAAAVLPLGLAAYVNPSAGSLFPLFPWAAFVFCGAGLGQIYARWGAANLVPYAYAVLFAPGALLVAAGVAGRPAAEALAAGGPAAGVPAEMVIRLGACLILLGVIAHVSVRIRQLPHAFGAVAQESLLIYFVHLCLVYGSIWNPGLARFYAASLTPLWTLVCVVGLIAAMVALAFYWNAFKHHRPTGARWTSYGVAAVLVGLLLI